MPRKRRSEDVETLVIATSPIKIQVEQFIEDTASIDDDDISALDRFAEDTSMLGFRYLHTRYKTWFRVLWGCVVVFFIGLTFYQVFERVTYYFIKNPLTTRRSYETLPNMYFPTIGVCNKMQIKASSVASKNPDLLRAMCGALDENTSNSTRFDELDKFDDVDILDVYRNSFQSADDLFVSCEFGKSGSCQDEIRPMYTPYGLCYSVSPNKTILRPGPETTLSLVLNLEVHDIIPGTVVEPGVILSIYDGASSLSHYSEGIHLEAGKVVTIPVNEVRKLRLHESSCGSTKMESFSEKEYSKSACEWSVSVKQIEKECGCIPIRNPIYRGIFDNKNENSTTPEKKPLKKWKKRKIPRCTLRQEIECVQEKLVCTYIQQETFKINIVYLQNIRSHIDDNICPDDCEDISFSSIVFGGKLSSSEIVSLLPSDWEDTKEKRVAAYQKALEVIPNRMIPVVRNVQQLADELQSFVKEASEIFGTSEKTNEVKCLSSDGRTYESFINQFNSYEPTWERITSYLQNSLARELNSTALCLGFFLDSKGELEESEATPVLNMTLASISLLQLGQIENSLGRANFNYGLTMMHESTRNVVLKLAHPLITEVKDCVTKMYDNLERVEEIAEDCRIIFKKRYIPLLEASHVYTKTNPASGALKEYSESVKKVLGRLQFMKTRVRMYAWNDFKIELKEFESLYRETAKDHLEIEDMLKLRKSMVTDIPKLALELSETFVAVTESRRKFAVLAGIDADERVNEKFSNFSSCLAELHESAPWLKVIERTVINQNCPESELFESELSCIRTVLYQNCPKAELSRIRTVLNQNCPEAELFVSELSRIRTVRIRTAPNQNYSISMLTA
uniref:Uncharacterized protein n=1 Tax=Caenorhabditis japonica TaxID=281687 RepID=A0A8R1HJ28_CAEJA